MHQWQGYAKEMRKKYILKGKKKPLGLWQEIDK